VVIAVSRCAADKTLDAVQASAGPGRHTHQPAELEHDWHVGLRLCWVQLWVAAAATASAGQPRREGEAKASPYGRISTAGRPICRVVASLAVGISLVLDIQWTTPRCWDLPSIIHHCSRPGPM
jgi:hypothetical protein